MSIIYSVDLGDADDGDDDDDDSDIFFAGLRIDLAIYVKIFWLLVCRISFRMMGDSCTSQAENLSRCSSASVGCVFQFHRAHYEFV